MEAREQILSAIRLGGAGSGTDSAVVRRLADKNQNVRPARSQDDDKVVDRYIEEAERAGTDIRKVADIQDIPEIIAAYLREQNLSGNIRVASSPLCQSINWNSEPMLSVSSGPAEPGDTASLSFAVNGIAETGTLVMSSGPENPAMLNYLPFLHIGVVSENNIVGGLETACTALRERSETNEAVMPRMLNLITGPSRTADIEQELLMGAHGPQKHMTIILKEE